jgi:signal peptidase II
VTAAHRPSPGPPGGSPGEPARPRRTAVLALTAGGLLVADVLTKVVVVAELMGREPVKLPGHFLWLTHARNPGAAFSFAEGATVLFTAVAAIVVAVIVRTATRLRSVAWAVSLGLVLGGAAGNLADRLFRSPGPLRGHVVDWISLRTPDGRLLFPIFNLADSGIVCGGILAVLLATLGYEMDGTRAGREPDPTPDGQPGPDAGRGPGGPPGPGPAGPPGPGVSGPPRAGDGYVPSAGPRAGPGRPIPGTHHPGAGP